MTMDMGIIISIVAVVIAAVSFIWQQFCLYASIRERLAKLETKVDLFWRMVEEKLSDLLLSPDNHIKDDLLAKLKGKRLSCKEAKDLKLILERESQLPGKTDLALAYFLVITRLEVLIEDLSRR